MTTVVSFHDVAKRYRRGRERVNVRAALPGRLGTIRGGDGHWALDGLSFDLEEGGSIGFIGPNGTGKSTTLKLVARVTSPTRGVVTVRGRTASLIELGAGFHPEMTGRENVYFSAAVLGMGPKTIKRRFERIVDFAGVDAYLDTPVKRYSSGMLARLGFAVASNLDADVVVLDEVLAVGDAAFQRKCHDRIAELRRAGAALLYVTHALWTVPLLCDEAILLIGGKVHAHGLPADVLREYERTQHEGELLVAGGEEQMFRGIRTSPTEIDPGGSFGMTVDLDLRQPYPEGHLLVILSDLEHRVFTATSSRESTTFEQPGRRQLSCRFDDLPLKPGRYQVHVGFLGDHRVPAVDDMRTIELTVRGDDVDPAYGAIKIATSWEIN